MSAEAAPVIDIAAILGLLFIRQPELTEDPHCFVIWARWWISCYGECAGTCTRTCVRETLEQTHIHRRARSLDTCTNTLAHINAPLLRCCHLPFGSISVAFANLPTYYFTGPQLAKEISSRAANGILTCKSHVGLNPRAQRNLLRANFRCWHHPLTATDLWAT